MGDQTVFIPGHGPESSFGRERKSNPYVGRDLSRTGVPYRTPRACAHRASCPAQPAAPPGPPPIPTNGDSFMSTQEHLQFYIDGQWVPPAVPRTLDVINPSTEEVAARISMGSAADVDAAVAAARRAFDGFSQTTRDERLACWTRCWRSTCAASTRWRRPSRWRWARRCGCRARAQAHGGRRAPEADPAGAQGLRVRERARHHRHRA